MQNVPKYIAKNGDNYTLETNTVASMKYKDTRLDENDPNYDKFITYTYDNPPEVKTEASEIEEDLDIQLI